MRRHWFPKPYADVVARLRVPGGFLLVAAFLWLSDPTPLSLLYGLPVSLLGLWLRGWAAGHIEKNERLRVRRGRADAAAARAPLLWRGPLPVEPLPPQPRVPGPGRLPGGHGAAPLEGVPLRLPGRKMTSTAS